MDERKITIGILGAGSMGAAHAAAYRAIDGAAVVGLWSRNSLRAESLAERSGTIAVVDPHELIEDGRIDAIDLCVPSAAHREWALAALRAGKHVLCESPMALDIGDAEAMIAAARAAKRLLCVGLLTRFIADYAYLLEQVQSGALGKLRSIALWRLGSYLLGRPCDEKKPHDSDPATELMTFDFDFLNDLLGPPDGLSASAARGESGAAGEITALLRYGNGVSATVTGSGIMPRDFPYTVGYRAVLDRAVIEHAAVFEDDVPASSLIVHAAGQTAAPLRLRRQNPYESELRYFVGRIQSGSDEELLSAHHALAALKLSIATQNSTRDGAFRSF